jgi:hypothetical protein
MKKKIFLLGIAGMAGGLLYALESSWRKQKTSIATERDESAGSSESSGNGRSSSTLANTNPIGSRSDRVASMARIESAAIESEGEHPIDDHGTGQSEAAEILRFVRDHAFEASNEKLALALGRPAEEIEQWTSGTGSIDGDVVIKARALAMHRGVEGDLA